MQHQISRWRALFNVGFVVATLAVAGFAVVQVASRQWRVQETFRVRARFTAIAGLEVGHRVRIQGIDAGVVEAIEPPRAPREPVTLVFRVDQRLRPLVRSDAVARIVSEGVVGAKVVEIAPGMPDAPPLSDAGFIAVETPIEMADLLRDARTSLKRVDAVASAAEKGLGEINAIATSIRKGEGSLGKLVQDEQAYQKLVALSDRSEHALHDMEENLAALKRTWPFSRYFNERAFFDRDRVLFHPNAERDSQFLLERDLFEPGRAVLTTGGRAKLDAIAAWSKKHFRANTEMVIAAFTDDQNDPDLAQILTQEQADAVRKYLVTRHSIDSIGWFSSRKVAAVGFGAQVPRGSGEDGAKPARRRVEFILFTPQT
jgi:phospholipid/cholesterol/gamma-HCH transport system substrate-binding protein